MHKLNIPVDSMEINNEDINCLISMLKNSNVTIFNNDVLKEFETNFANFLSTEKPIHSIVLPNCTSAIFIALQLLNLEEDDEIIVPNITHSSAILALIQLKKPKIKICDFKKDSYDLDINHLQTLISPKTKGVLLSYLHGFTFNIKEIAEICEIHDIPIIEDTAQGLGVEIDQNKAGTIGKYGCFSFGANKLLKMGEGGAITTKNKNDINSINLYRHVGEVWKQSKLSTIDNNSTYDDILNNGFDYIVEGFNFRSNPLSVALAMNSLKNLDETINTRRRKLMIYHSILKEVKGFQLINDNIQQSAPISAWFIVDQKIFSLNKIILKCLEYGIPVGKFKYSTVSNIKLFDKYILNKKDTFKNSEKINANSLFLPLYENISFFEIESIAIKIKEIFKNYHDLDFDENILKKQIEYFNGFFLK